MASNTFDDDDDSLYSESLDGRRLRPTDGYFHSRQHPQELYVDAAPDSTGSKDDTSIESLLHSCLSKSSAVPGAPMTSSSFQRADERTPLLRADTPPPAYRPRSFRASSSTTGAGTLTGQGYGGVAAPFMFPDSGEPQTMRESDVEPEGNNNDPNPTSEEWKKPGRSSCCKQIFLKILAALVALGAFSWIAMFFLVGEGPKNPTEPWKPANPTKPIPGHFSPEWPDRCSGSGIYSKKYEFEHLESFQFSDLVTGSSNIFGAFGTVQVLSGPDDQVADLAIIMESTSEDFDIQEESSSAQLDRSLNFQQKSYHRSSCLAADIALYFRPGLKLINLQISSASLAVYISSNLVVDNTTHITLQSGGLTSQPFVDSRKTYIDTGSNSVSGDYPVYDLLQIHSTSGSITVDLEPKAADKNHPSPAVLSLKSQSGAIKVNYPATVADIPEREYHTTVISTGGLISGKYLHGKSTVIESSSGGIAVELLPYAADMFASTLTTKSNSGSQNIHLLSPYLDSKTPVSRLRSTHTVSSGLLVLHYPEEWEGRLSGKTMSGSLLVVGREVNIIDSGSRGGGKYVIAEKGDGNSTLAFDTKSGSVRFGVGSFRYPFAHIFRGSRPKRNSREV